MSGQTSALAAFLAANARCICVTIAEAKGSTPREQGAWMLVSDSGTFGTIGGGQLEFRAIAVARSQLENGVTSGTLALPLGPEIGQCCGGHVRLDLAFADAAKRAGLTGHLTARDAARPQIFVFGAGHVGHALAEALALLPFAVTLVETRNEALAGLPVSVATLLTPVPEEAVRSAAPGSAFVVLTHDHALDFLILTEVLRRGDAAYAGMIGSQTKREMFRRYWLNEAGGEAEALVRLSCPLGGTTQDKRPAVIAALAAAEVVRVLTP